MNRWKKNALVISCQAERGFLSGKEKMVKVVIAA